jgi:hypothetical protein
VKTAGCSDASPARTSPRLHEQSRKCVAQPNKNDENGFNLDVVLRTMSEGSVFSAERKQEE